MAEERRLQPPSRHVPEFDRRVGSRRGQPIAALREGHGSHTSRVGRERRQLLAAGRIAERDQTVLAGASDERPVRRPGHRVGRSRPAPVARSFFARP